MDRWIDRLISNHKPVLIVLVLITIPFVYYFSKQTYFNHINVFFPKGDPEIKYYEAFQDKFGNDDVAAIVFKTDDIFTAGNIELIRNITAAIKPFVGVQRVTSLTETEVARGSEDTVDFQKLLPESTPLTPENLASARAEAIKHPMISGNLLSRDGTTTAIVIELTPSTSYEAKRDLLADKRLRIRLDRVPKRGRGLQAKACNPRGIARLLFCGKEVVQQIIIALPPSFCDERAGEKRLKRGLQHIRLAQLRQDV